jgi:hypothetical protein
MVLLGIIDTHLAENCNRMYDKSNLDCIDEYILSENYNEHIIKPVSTLCRCKIVANITHTNIWLRKVDDLSYGWICEYMQYEKDRLHFYWSAIEMMILQSTIVWWYIPSIFNQQTNACFSSCFFFEKTITNDSLEKNHF